MKLHLIMFAQLILVNSACTSQKKPSINNDSPNVVQKISIIDKITITEQTRGTNRSIVYTPKGILKTVNGVETTIPISTEEWKNIEKEANLIDLSKFSSYESSTTGRFSDRALSSTIKITSGNSNYESATFDEGIPPKEYEVLYRLLKDKSEIGKKPKQR